VEVLITSELAKSLCSISYELNRQIGVLINRSGNITHIIIGSSQSILIPELENFPIGKSL